MVIFDDVVTEMKKAMRARDRERLSALRNIRAAFLVCTKKDGSDTLTDPVCVEVLRRLAKQRKESIDAFEGAGRAERAAAERAELGVIKTWLPSLADENQTREWVREAIASTGVTSAKEVGRVMGAVMKAHKGEVDGALARQLASGLLG